MRIEGQESGDLGQTKQKRTKPNKDKETQIDQDNIQTSEKKKKKHELEM